MAVSTRSCSSVVGGGVAPGLRGLRGYLGGGVIACGSSIWCSLLAGLARLGEASICWSRKPPGVRANVGSGRGDAASAARRSDRGDGGLMS